MIDQRSQKSKTTLRDVRKDLRAIYEKEDGSIPDMSTFSKKKSGLQRFFVRSIFVLLVISVAAWTGFFVFSNGLFQKQDQLVVKIEGPDSAKAGELVSYSIQYENTGDIPIATLELSASFPPDFHLLSSVPEANEKNTWMIGSLTPKSDGKIILNGIFLSEVPSTQKLQALFTYKPANFNSSFQTIQTKDVKIENSVLKIEMNGPDRALPGDEIEYVIKIAQEKTEGKEKKPVQTIRVIPTLPQNFTITQTEPAFENGLTYWNTKLDDKNDPKPYTIKGSFTSSASGDQIFGSTIGYVESDTYLKQAESTKTTIIQGGSVAFHLIVNGSNTDQSVDANKILRGSIDFTNQSDAKAKNISFTLALDGSGTLPIDWSHADLHGAKQKENKITWDETNTDSLKLLEKNASGVIDFSLPLSLSSSTTDHFTLTLTSHIDEQKDQPARTISTTPMLISINAQVGFSSEARYFTEEGQPIGSGPLPPKVGEQTSYRVFFTLTNSLHELSGISVSTILPSNVTWSEKNKTDIGTMAYNTETRTVTWFVSKLPTSIPKAGSWFDVSVKPVAKDVDTSIPLTGTTTFTAKDTSTSQTLTQSADTLTTNLLTDEFANGKGTVKK